MVLAGSLVLRLEPHWGQGGNKEEECMIEPTKDTLEREGFWTYEQAIDQDLSDALDEFRAETNRRTDVLL